MLWRSFRTWKQQNGTYFVYIHCLHSRYRSLELTGGLGFASSGPSSIQNRQLEQTNKKGESETLHEIGRKMVNMIQWSKLGVVLHVHFFKYIFCFRSIFHKIRVCCHWQIVFGASAATFSAIRPLGAWSSLFWFFQTFSEGFSCPWKTRCHSCLRWLSERVFTSLTGFNGCPQKDADGETWKVKVQLDEDCCEIFLVDEVVCFFSS